MAKIHIKLPQEEEVISATKRNTFMVLIMVINVLLFTRFNFCCLEKINTGDAVSFPNKILNLIKRS